MAKSDPDAVGVTLLQADADAARRRFDQAEKLLLAARAKSADQVQLWTALISLAGRQQHWEKVEQLLAEAEKKFGDRVWLRIARGTYFVARYKQAAAARLKPLSDKTAAFSPADRLVLARGLATLSLAAGDMAEARALARRACDAAPKNLEARLFLFDLAFRAGDAAAVKRVLDEIRGLEGESAMWHYGQAALCLLTKPATPALDAAAFAHIDAARKLRPDWSALPMLTAQIQDRAGQQGPALQNYLAAIDLGERNPAAVRRAVELLNAKQRYAEADQLLRRLDQQPMLASSDVERMASQVSARLDDLDRALAMARKVAANSKQWQDQVWLGQLESVTALRAKAAGQVEDAKSRLAEAEASLRAAVKLKPDAPEPWVALIRFYAAVGRKADAETTIHLAERKLPPETAALALASSYEAIGDKAAAAKQYQALLATGAKDARILQQVADFEIRTGKLADAETHLRTIVSGHVKAKPAEVVVARRELAAVLRASGKYPKVQEALALIAQNLAAGSAPEDLREKALALAVCPQPDRRAEAVSILAKLLDSQPNNDDLRAALAQIDLAQNNWPQAAKLLRNLLANHGKDPQFIALYATQLLQHQEADEADLWIGRLEDIAPGGFAAAGLKAESLVQHGQVDAAIRTLHDGLAGLKLSASERVRETQMVAARLETLARGMTRPDQSADAAKLLGEAERLYRQDAQAEPDRQLALAAFLARQRRFDEALAIVAAAGHAADPNDLAQVFVELTAGEEQGAGGKGQKAASRAAVGGRIEKLLLAAIEEHGHAPNLLIALANLRMQQDRFDEAIDLYREVLKKDAAKIVAMNNLAMLLGLKKQHLDDALGIIDRAIATVGPLPALLDSRATVYLALDKPREALADLDEAVKAEPRPNREFHRALALDRLGQPKAAARALAEARRQKLKPEDLNALELPAYRALTAKLK